MTKIIRVQKDTDGKGLRVTTRDEDGNESSLMLTADFCHYCKDDIGKEFEEFMKAKGYDIKRNA